MAEGSGYRHIEIPGQPWQTKYPILYPAVLSLGFAIWGEYPRNMSLLLVPGALAGAGFIVLAAIYLRRVFGLSRAGMIAIAMLATLSPPIVSLVRFAMSDLLFAADCRFAILYRPQISIR